nr:MAG TPA: hypothetical protein [Caudoviricetes sp.]
MTFETIAFDFETIAPFETIAFAISAFWGRL